MSAIDQRHIGTAETLFGLEAQTDDTVGIVDQFQTVPRGSLSQPRQRIVWAREQKAAEWIALFTGHA